MQKNKSYKIIFTGPESSGKTTLAKLAANHYSTHWLPEYARTYLEQIDYPYQIADLLKIAEGQVSSEQQFIKKNRNQDFLFFDTSLLVIKVWSIFKYGFYNHKIDQLLKQNLPDIYFLCDWQIPWEYDPLREAPNDRKALFDLYHQELLELDIHFHILKGTPTERLAQIQTQLELIYISTKKTDI